MPTEIVRRVRRDDDMLARQLDFRLAIPAGALWASLLVASWGGWLDLPASLWIVGVTLGIAGVAVALVRMPRSRHRLFPGGSTAALVALTAFTIGLGFAGHAVSLAVSAGDPLAVIGADPSHRFDIQAQVITTPRAQTHSFDRESWKVTLQVHRLTWRGRQYHTRAKLQVKGKGWQEIPLGATVGLRLGLKEFDYSGQFLGFAKSPGTPRLLAAPSGRFVYVNAVRGRLNQATTHLAGDIRAMIGAMSLGLTVNQPEADREAMQVAGLSHLTAVSGLHLSVLVGLALGLTSRRSRLTQALSAAVLMVVFLAMLEGSSSVTRAAVMGTITLFGLALARPSRSITALSLAVIAMLLITPWQATSWGFALSVVATFSIVTLGQFLSRWLAMFLPRLLAFPLAVSLSAQLGCQPLMLIMRGNLQVFSLPANLTTGAVSSIVTVGGLVLVGLATGVWGAGISGLAPLAAGLQLLTDLTAQVTGGAAAWILGVARFFSRLPGAEIPWIESGYGVAGLIITTTGFVWLTWRFATIRRWRVGSGSRAEPGLQAASDSRAEQEPGSRLATPATHGGTATDFQYHRF